MKTSELKEYLEKNNLEFKITLKEKENGDDLTKQDIKFNPVLFSEYFLLFLDEFLRLFQDKEFSNKDKEEINECRNIYLDLYQLQVEFREMDIEYGKGEIQKLIRDCVKVNHEKINELFDLCWEMFEQ